VLFRSEYVDVDLDGDKAARLAIEAQEAADRATALMAQAQAAAEAATEAQRLADEAAAAITPDAPVKGTKPKKTQTSAQAAPANGDPAAAS
jgi:hypothetical protein